MFDKKLIVLLSDILSIILLLGIFVQDYKQRSVQVWILGLLFFSFLLRGLQQIAFTTLMKFAGINLVFLIINLVCLHLYFLFKEKRFFSLIDTYLGKGDVVFWLCLAVFFSPANFIMFFILSLVVSLAGYFVLQLTGFNTHSTVPLAGLQAFQLVMLLVAGFVYKSSNVLDDNLLLNRFIYAFIG